MQIVLFSVVWELTVMHRCCGVYDLGFSRVAVAALNLLFILCVSVSDYAPTSSCRVCAVTAVPHGCGTVASGMRERTLRAHHVVIIVCSHQHCAGWMAPNCRRCGGPRASSTVPSHRAYGTLVLAVSHFCA
ncbi:retrotransposon hot spot (RHS) protein [Trypanosoma cruzi]|nr:retrotransposon hot spot (RHS) protein [Trypanosoma cruzi]